MSQTLFPPFVLGLLLLVGLPLGADPFPPVESDRIVCLGDSITDGNTYPQIIMQALQEAGKPVPPAICAGVAGNTAPQMAARVERSVLRFEPDIVTFSAGSNDVLGRLEAAKYEKALREICRRVDEQGGTMVLLTPCPVMPHGRLEKLTAVKARELQDEINTLLDQYEAAIRRVAREKGYRVAENRALMRAALKEGEQIMVEDGIHPNYTGQSLMARSILDAIGGEEVPLPEEFDPPLFPGVIREWKMRPAKGKLDAETVRELRPDGEDWVTYRLPDPVPEEEPSADDWWEQERRNGFGLRVPEVVHKGPVWAVADLEEPEARRAWVNLGIGVRSVWLNGERVWQHPGGWTGFHAGKHRVVVELEKGKDRLVVGIKGPNFFLSVTERLVWEELLFRGE